MDLSAEEVRVLGCLVEKSATTPDNYPLSTNALTNGCNQKTSREPVVSYTDRTVSETMLLVRASGLARTVTGSGRVEKHRHTLDEAWGLTGRELAVMAIMMLRGPQSAGELKTRTERYVDFGDLHEIETVLGALADRDEPMVRNVGRGSGQSQDRWTHLLGGDAPMTPAMTTPEMMTPAAVPTAAVSAPVVSAAATPAAPTTPAASHSVSDLEFRVADLEQRLANIERELGL
ncbi:MAG: hypothetical protein ACI8TP_004740 [Acidimicrobiales bacterium]|jgi:uncharacterized protein